jgi:DNA-binding MarR family transcriptional regulator
MRPSDPALPHSSLHPRSPPVYNAPRTMNPTRLVQVLRLHGDFRKILAPIRVTPSQAGVLLVLRRHADARVTDAAAALGVSQATMSRMVTALMRKRWVSKRRSVKDDRVVVVLLSRRGRGLARQIEQRVAAPARAYKSLRTGVSSR